MASSRSRVTKMKGVLDELLEEAQSFSFKVGRLSAKVYAVEIDPALAERLIEHCNPRNRTIRQKKVGDYATKMGKLRWRLEHMLMFSESGELIDGQHRLRALIDSGVPVSFLIQVIKRGQEEDANLNTDSGVPRNLADFLHFNGVSNAHRAAPVLVFERNERISGNPMQFARGEKPDYLAIWREIGEEPFKTAFDVVPRGLKTQLGVNGAFLDWYALRLSQIDSTEAAVFIELLVDGSQQKKSDPTFILREKLMKMARKRNDGTLRVSLTEQAHMIAHSWRLHAENSPAKPSDIRFNPREDWPGIAGAR